MFPIVVIAIATLFFFAAERTFPARELPEAPGWYTRAAFLNFCQVAIVVMVGLLWNRWAVTWSVFHIAVTMPSMVQGWIGWFLGTFVFYWWHRARHEVDLLWRLFHQVHHSPSRIEILTAFYKHPVEILADSLISSALLYVFLGASAAGGAWFSVFAALGEYFYHSNLRTPHWVGYFLQRPEHHSIHHQLDVHRFNYGDITWWDRLFGTFRDTEVFAPQCGFPHGHERKLGPMLLFRDCY